jgi:hypothetical protein
MQFRRSLFVLVSRPVSFLNHHPVVEQAAVSSPGSNAKRKFRAGDINPKLYCDSHDVGEIN